MKVDTSALESPILENEPPAQSVSAIQVVEMKKEKLYSFLNEVQKWLWSGMKRLLHWFAGHFYKVYYNRS